MDADNETGGKNGVKGDRNEAEGENVNVVLPTGSSDDLDGNRTQREAVRHNDAIEGTHDSVTGQDLTETGWPAKNLELGVMETTGETAHYDGEPTESDVIYNLDGSVGFRDRSLGGEFVLVGGGRKKLEGPDTEKATMGKMTVAADTDAATRMEYETNQKAIADAVILEKARFEMERRRLGPQPMSSLAAQISKGEVGSRGIGKLSMLGPAKTTTKTAANNQLRARKTQTEANRDTQVAENRGKVQTKAPLQSTAVEAKEAQGSVSKAAAAATGVVSRTMGAAKFAVAKATTVWSSRSATTSTEKPMVESDTASGRETPRIQNSATAQQSNDCEMRDDTKASAAEKSELETGVTTTDSEFISMGLVGFENQSMAMEDNETEARKEWQMVEERELDQGAYRVWYEYSEKMDSAPRSTSSELRSLAL
jgi:hypothetical protein